MAIRIFISIILFIPAFILAMRYNLHMLQLNGYKNDEHFRWIQKNIRKQWLLLLLLPVGILRTIFPILWLDVAGWLVLAVIIIVYHALKKQNVKKKLVYTARVKRLIFTDSFINACILAAFFLSGGRSRIPGILYVEAALQFIWLIVVNLINHPVEWAVNQHYINDAKKRLKSVPGLKIIGVTGSYGKTSVKFYLQTLLQGKYHVLVTPESFNTPMGVVRTIREHLKPTHEIFVCEMGARHVGDIKEVCDIVHPMHGVITSVGPQHLETFYNMENIKNTKFELADALPEGGMLFLNGDNEYIQDKAGEYKNKVFYYADGQGDGYYAKDISLSQLGTEFTVVAPDGEEERFQMRLIGGHNVINVVGAIAVAHTMGISLKELKIPVRRIQAVEHRMQMIEKGDVTIIDDAYNSNPVGSKAAVETLAMFDGVRILITPGMVELGEKEEEYNYKFGTYAADCCDYILLVGRAHTEPIRKGAISGGFIEEKCQVFDRIEDAVTYAYAIREQGHKYILLENDLPDNY